MAIGFYVDLTSCIGCRTCQVACKDRHDMHEVGPRPRRVETYEYGTYPSATLVHDVMSCNHCENPACVASCPTGAMFKSKDGAVLHDDSACVLCRMCMVSCPYGAPQLDTVNNMIVKCDTCKSLREAGGEPTCVAACPMRAIHFGEIEDLKAQYGADLVSDLPHLPTSEWTNPNVLYKAPEAISQKEFVAVTL